MTIKLNEPVHQKNDESEQITKSKGHTQKDVQILLHLTKPLHYKLYFHNNMAVWNEAVPGYICNHGSPKDWDTALKRYGNAFSDTCSESYL